MEPSTGPLMAKRQAFATSKAPTAARCPAGRTVSTADRQSRFKQNMAIGLPLCLGKCVENEPWQTEARVHPRRHRTAGRRIC